MGLLFVIPTMTAVPRPVEGTGLLLVPAAFELKFHCVMVAAVVGPASIAATRPVAASEVSLRRETIISCVLCGGCEGAAARCGGGDM